MAEARLIVCEKTGQWAAALRRRASGSAISFRETRSLTECWEELAEYPGSMLALEARPENLEELVARLSELRDRYPRARAVVLFGHGPENGAWLFRESGAVHVVQSTLESRAVLRMVRRHLEAVADNEDSDETAGDGWQRRIYARLPWPAVAG